MSRRRNVAISAFALVLIAAPFLPDGGAPPAIETASVPGDVLAGATAGPGAVTPAMRREIDAVLARGRTAARATAGVRLRPAALVRSQVRCAEFEGQRYCLGQGWTDETEDEVVDDLASGATAESARVGRREQTGDAGVLEQLRRRASLSPTAQQKADRAELVAAARSVAKVWLLRNQIQGVPLPDGFLDRHPEIRFQSALARPAALPTNTASPTSSPTTTTAPTTSAPTVKTQKDYPEGYRILDNDETREQTRTYWCGPTTMQMIAWGWRGYAQSQDFWAGKLGTTRNGTAITDMVRVTNNYTGWDRDDHAGKYVVLDIKDWSYGQWWLLQMRHYYDYKAPVILHPILLKKWYPYLDDNASGHFQVGRGYHKRGDRANVLRYFEPWNQQRFDPSEPYIERRQWRSAYKSYRANQEHFQHNIGV